MLVVFLRAFASLEIVGHATAPLNALVKPEPFAMCAELLLLLSDDGDAAALVQSGLLTVCPHLWPSALTWAIVSGDIRARALFTQKPPNVRFLNDLFYHASVCVCFYSVLTSDCCAVSTRIRSVRSIPLSGQTSPSS
jgi:hypothetical protein